MQADPNVRADRFVERWQELQGQRQQLRGWQHDEARGKVEGQMQGLPRALNATRRLNPSCAIAGRKSGSVSTCARTRGFRGSWNRVLRAAAASA
jgi:hypothetical protein